MQFKSYFIYNHFSNEHFYVQKILHLLSYFFYNYAFFFFSNSSCFSNIWVSRILFISPNINASFSLSSSLLGLSFSCFDTSFPAESNSSTNFLNSFSCSFLNYSFSFSSLTSNSFSLSFLSSSNFYI